MRAFTELIQSQAKIGREEWSQAIIDAGRSDEKSTKKRKKQFKGAIHVGT